jgi:hypothetical protein
MTDIEFQLKNGAKVKFTDCKFESYISESDEVVLNSEEGLKRLHLELDKSKGHSETEITTTEADREK